MKVIIKQQIIVTKELEIDDLSLEDFKTWCSQEAETVDVPDDQMNVETIGIIVSVEEQHMLRLQKEATLKQAEAEKDEQKHLH